MSRSRTGLSVLLIVALALTGAAREFAASQRAKLVAPIARATQLKNLNSYSLGLVLGGLRGPLVMYLWTSSENQKNERQLEDVDTKLEMIRLLQGDFDQVLIFQTWNKAYNLSVQMASLSNKYTCILDAMDYARRMDAERPDNLNITSVIASLYFDKLGGSAEKRYYSERIRQETLPPEPIAKIKMPQGRFAEFTALARAAGVEEARIEVSMDPAAKTALAMLRKSDADKITPQFRGEGITCEYQQPQARKAEQVGQRTLRHVQMLDENGHLLPQFTKPDGRHVKPENARSGEWNDGSELQYLKRYDTPEAGGFPHGLSPLALAYNYFKRAQVIQANTGQKHLQLSEGVVDSRPAVGLKAWGEEEWERGRRYESIALGLKPTADKLNMELPAATLGPTDLKDAPALADALFAYDRAARLADDAIHEYERHVREGNFTASRAVYLSHKDVLLAMRALMRGDAAYARLLSAPPQERAKLIAAGREAYQEAIDRYYAIILKYYIEVDVAAEAYPMAPSTDGTPRRYTKETITRADLYDATQPGLDPSLFPFVHARAVAVILTPVWAGGRGGSDLHRDDRNEYEKYIGRANRRLAAIARIESGKAPPSTTILGP